MSGEHIMAGPWLGGANEVRGLASTKPLAKASGSNSSSPHARSLAHHLLHGLHSAVAVALYPWKDSRAGLVYLAARSIQPRK